MKYPLIYGGIAGAIVVGLTGIALSVGILGHDSSPFFGYLVMLVALSMIFLGVKRYRDVECGGVVRFGRALAVGLGIAAVAALFYVVGWEMYLATSERDFIAEYTANLVRDMREAGEPAGAIAAREREMRDFAVQYRNPLFRMPLTFIEIFPVGLVVALVSAALLRNPPLLPAAR
jgi:hypothetical protein